MKLNKAQPFQQWFHVLVSWRQIAHAESLKVKDPVCWIRVPTRELLDTSVYLDKPCKDGLRIT